MRLFQGDYAQETVYSDNPVAVALKWQSMGAPRLHIVDLDGAIAGNTVNFNVISQIAQSAMVPIQVGGGIRDLSGIRTLLKAGVDRVVLGTAAVENPELVREACRNFSESIIVSLDARDGKMAVKGWQEETDISVIDFARQMTALGVKRFVFTDISRDGTLTEPNFTALFELIQTIKVPVIASGGIARLSHLKILKLLGASAAILGKSIYSGAINLKQALEQ